MEKKELSMDELEGIYARLKGLPPHVPMGENQRVDFLRETFGGDSSGFARFMGYVKRVLIDADTGVEEAVRIMDDLALAALSIGFKDGLKY